jgi:DNA mismatch repair ATPase MutS
MVFNLDFYFAQSKTENRNRRWMLRPILSQSTIEERLDVVGFLSNPENLELFNGLERNLKSVKDIPRILARVREFKSSVTDWSALFEVRPSYFSFSPEY